jgi:hypothetical protein
MQAVDAVVIPLGKFCRSGRICRVKLRDRAMEIAIFIGFSSAARPLLP